MTDRDPWSNDVSRQDLSNDGLDRQLDAALAKYVAVEPRTGLEERVLANIRAQRERSAMKSWWRWPAVAALTVLLVVAIFVTSRSSRPAPNVATDPSATHQTIAHDGRSAVKTPVPSDRSRRGSDSQRRSSPRRHPAPVFASAPRLDQFPSPEPLSEQETILARYVTKYPEHAALIAQARTEELRQDSAEETGLPAIENSPARNK
jgi:hypothetical protein